MTVKNVMSNNDRAGEGHDAGPSREPTPSQGHQRGGANSAAKPIAATRYAPADALVTARLTTGSAPRTLIGRSGDHDDGCRDACGGDDGTR
jgi:hypothetical protein